MLYDPPQPGTNTPFIPPLPSPDAPVQPPVIPDGQTTGPAWAQQPVQPAAYPYHPAAPTNQTPYPYLPPLSFATPGMAPPRLDPPGSYYPAPAALPNFSMPPPGPYMGYPDLTHTPWAPPGPMPPPQAWNPNPQTGYPTPHMGPTMAGWAPPMMTPGAMPWGIPPMTPYGMPGAMPGMMPGGMPGATPWQPPMPMATPWMPPTNPPVPVPPMDDGPHARWANNIDRMDPFMEGPHYGPVLDPFLIKVVKATVKVNPLLLYERDGKADCLAWNMIFRANNCCRSTDPSRSWTRGRNAPATHPRVTQLRIISRQIPWVINIRAQDHSIGVTCGEVIDGISHFLQGDCARRDYDQLDRLRRRYVWDAYVFNRSTDPHVPGGELGEALKRLDWLGPDSKFGGLVVDEELVKEACGDVLPCVFELKCLPRDLPTPTSSSATS